MKACKANEHRMAYPRDQRGVVLLIALIILVAMSLAGIGMMRSVDTGSVIAGNLAFQQASLHASDEGSARAFASLVGVANSANPLDKAILNFNHGQPCANVPGATAAGCPASPGPNINFPGYSPAPIFACEVRRTCLLETNYRWWLDANNWIGAPTFNVTDAANPANPPLATVSYLIHRMCELGGPSGFTTCQTYTQPATGCSKTQLLPCKSTSLFYRVTTRTVGMRNSVTYTQTLVLIAG